jgi:uncharacterized membrane protein
MLISARYVSLPAAYSGGIRNFLHRRNIMKLSVRTLTIVLAATLIVAFTSNALAQWGQGGRGLGPGGGVGDGVPGSVNCINAGSWVGASSRAYCPYSGCGMGYGFISRQSGGLYSPEITRQPNLNRGQNRGFGGQGAGRGNVWR